MSIATYQREIRSWRIDGQLIHPIEAYSRAEYWLADFEAKFPAKAAKMKAYSTARVWNRHRHVAIWVPVVLGWLNKQGDTSCEPTNTTPLSGTSSESSPPSSPSAASC